MGTICLELTEAETQTILKALRMAEWQYSASAAALSRLAVGDTPSQNRQYETSAAHYATEAQKTLDVLAKLPIFTS